MMSPELFADDFIFRWEDGKQTDPKKTHSMRQNDRGNWNTGVIGKGSLIGSNHGVTSIALAEYRKVPVRAITYDVMHALGRAEAGRVALANYYRANKLDRLPWSPLIASAFDFGWGVGPFRGVEKYQDLVGAVDDGLIGLGTLNTSAVWLSKRSMEQACREWAEVRNAYYEATIRAKPEQAENRNGWRNRTAYFLPGHPERWWERFNA